MWKYTTEQGKCNILFLFGKQEIKIEVGEKLQLDSNPLEWSVADVVRFLKSTDCAPLARIFLDQVVYLFYFINIGSYQLNIQNQLTCLKNKAHCPILPRTGLGNGRVYNCRTWFCCCTMASRKAGTTPPAAIFWSTAANGSSMGQPLPDSQIGKLDNSRVRQCAEQGGDGDGMKLGSGGIDGSNITNILSSFMVLICLPRSTWTCSIKIELSRPIQAVKAYPLPRE